MMEQYKSPCKGCEQYHACAIHEVACEQYQWFVESGEIELALPKSPTRKIFMEVYFEESLEGEF